MFFDDILKKFKSENPEGEKSGEEFVEVSSSEEVGPVRVRVENLKGFSDSDKIQGFLREGNIVFLKIRDLREKDMSELKRSVDRLRKTVTAMNGDMVGVDEDFLVVTPKYARVYRGKVS